MQPNLTDATIEFLFTPQETIIVKQLDALHINWFQTKYAQIWKHRASISVPNPTNQQDVSNYCLEIAELDGKLAMLQEILDDHKNALNELKIQKAETDETQRQEQEDLSQRASQNVNK